ncbi:MAG: TonB-dependent receptor [Flavobacteriaceae bacterium]|nr:MAG: TonB-dependent receptor [Flavobacteriaceae bacterium]
MKKTLFSSLILVFITTITISQNKITGIVTNHLGEILPGASITIKGTHNGTIVANDGTYLLVVKQGATIVCRHIGYKSKELTVQESVLNFKLLSNLQLHEIQIVGSRNKKRTITKTTVPVDIIDVDDISKKTGMIELNRILQFSVPSFNANKQSGSDGSDHIIPATLRGLGPDQTLVLINGKRRHQSSLINVYGTRGRGNTGTDLNAIPTSAIKRIEVLRDGASAQYGSDAIAGVINIVLKDHTGEFTGNITTGISKATPPNRYNIATGDKLDGLTLQANANFGIKLKENGFANFTLDISSIDFTKRAIDLSLYKEVFREKFGDAATKNVALFGNIETPISENTKIYLFGGVNKRDSEAYAWTRHADDLKRNVPSIYPNGYNPIIGTDITDVSASLGVKTHVWGWNLDVNTTFGQNEFVYHVKNTLNASLQEASPTKFDAGSHHFRQIIGSIDLTKHYSRILSGLNIAIGTEYRLENFQIHAGEEKSYKNYNTDYAGSSQGFPGFHLINEIDESRSNVAVYIDGELNFSKKSTGAVAVRYENYDDFGSTVTVKIAGRQEINQHLAMRGSISTGFRAPSLAQRFYNTIITDYQAGVASETIIANNESGLAEAFGIDKLREEKANNYSTGITYSNENFNATIDAYFVNIKDRVTLSGGFDASDLILGIKHAQFFSNTLDTKTIGLDIVLSYKIQTGNSIFFMDLIGNINKMKLGDVKVSERLKGQEEMFFGAREKYFLLASAPDNKFSANFTLVGNKLTSNIRLTRFGQVELLDWQDNVDTYIAKFTTDISFGIPINDHIKFSIGSNNFFNTYPKAQNPNYTEAGGLWDSVQMGYTGAFYYTRLGFKF